MKAFFNDKIIAKLRKLPAFLWFIILSATYFARDAFNTIYFAKEAGETYRQMLAELEMTSINITPIVVVIAILSPIIGAAIFELIVFLAHSILSRRYVMAINRSDFSFRARLVMIFANILLALIHIADFFVAADVASLISSIVDFAVPALLFMWYYEDFRSRFLPKARHAAFFRTVAVVYVGIDFALSLISFIEGMVAIAVNSVLITAAVCVSLGMSVLVGLAAYFNYLRLKKISDGPEDNDLFIKKEEKPDNVEIFKGFGF